MKPNIHPKYGPLELLCTNGTSFTTGSTKPGQMKLGIDLYNHWAWNKEKKITESDEGTVAKFNSRLGSDFFNKDVLR